MTALNFPPRTPGSTGRRIVVGVDGSAASMQALAWVRDSLLEPSDQLCVVTAYQLPLYGAEVPVNAMDPAEIELTARTTAQEAIRSVFGSEEPSGGLVHVVEIGSIDSLIDRHESGAAFVVLGSRSRRRISERLRSSATNRITGRTRCPVISVPESDDSTPAGRTTEIET